MRTWLALPCVIALSIAGLHCGDDDDATGASGSAGGEAGGGAGTGGTGGSGGSGGSSPGPGGSGGGTAGYGGSGGSSGGAGGGAGAAVGGGAGAAGAEAAQATLGQVQSVVFDSSKYACSSPSCHGGKQALNLTAGKSYNALVNQGSTFAAGQTLVVPGEPESSVLYKILLGPVGKAGRMPDNGVKASAGDIELVRDWIASGAKDD